MRVLSLIIFVFSLCLSVVNAQVRDCGTMENLQQLIDSDPELPSKMEDIEKATQAFLNEPENRVVEGIITIPVVFHVVWNTAAENLSTAQIQSQLDILTEDFRRLNSDADSTWPQADDSEIEFCLATIDPDGNPTDGITRTNTSTTSFNTNNNVKFNSSGGHDAWPRADYLNFWVCDLSGGLLGYAQFPGGPAATDGIVCDYQYVGDIGTATPPYELGRTATHEVGHWLNLRHIWGDGGCGVDDLVGDTPLSDASNGGCPVGHVSCGSVDMVQNYMDYTFDSCMNLFTTGQKDRMRALFEPGGFRVSLLSSEACGASSIPGCTNPEAHNYNPDATEDDGSCETCSDGILNGDEEDIDCGGVLCAPCPIFGCTDPNAHNYNPDATDDDGSCETCNDGLLNGDEEEVDCGGVLCGPCPVYGCTDPVAHNYNPDATDDDGSCETCSDGVLNGDEEDIDCGGVLCGSCPIFGCTNPDAHNYNPDATDDDGSCETCSDGILNGDEEDIDCGGVLCGACPIFGCTNPDAHNYNPDATNDDGSCETCNDGIQNGDETAIDCGGSLCNPCEEPPVPGCTNPSAHNYNSDATQDDGSCETCSDGLQNGDETAIDCGGSLCESCPIQGCTNPEAHNFNPDATEENGSCETCTDGILNGDEIEVDCGGVLCASCDDPPVPGCTDPNAHNYNPNATQNDGSCETCTDGTQNGDETGVDCGGSLCIPCSGSCAGTTANLFIQLDNYPEETSWSLTHTNGTLIASGGTYGNLADGATVSEEFCLQAGCYNFTIYDIYEDGLCCNYGEGYYELIGNNSTTLASGGVFKAFETTIFCVGGAEHIEGCTQKEAHNYNPEATLDDGSCETCFDEVQNGDETGVDCGGELCAPCNISGCAYETIDYNNFETTWGIWNDGGSDCRRSTSDAAYANSAPYCIRLRDNSNTSITTTDNIDLADYEELTIAFSFYARSMENNEDFWLQISTDAGASYTTKASWARGSDFNNNTRYFETVVIPGPFTNATRIRFRCDASSNSDYIYLDDIEIAACNNGNGNTKIITEEAVMTEEEEPALITIGSIYPNPASSVLNVKFISNTEKEAMVQLFDLTGKLMQSSTVNLITGKQTESFDLNHFENGIYFLHLTTDKQRIVEKFVVTK